MANKVPKTYKLKFTRASGVTTVDEGTITSQDGKYFRKVTTQALSGLYALNFKGSGLFTYLTQNFTGLTNNYIDPATGEPFESDVNDAGYYEAVEGGVGVNLSMTVAYPEIKGRFTRVLALSVVTNANLEMTLEHD